MLFLRVPGYSHTIILTSKPELLVLGLLFKKCTRFPNPWKSSAKFNARFVLERCTMVFRASIPGLYGVGFVSAFSDFVVQGSWALVSIRVLVTESASCENFVTSGMLAIEVK